jgi:mRNA interferase MazF
VKRGEIWIASGGADYVGKPRPVVIVQDDRFDALVSVTVCALTSVIKDVSVIRPTVEPGEANGLAAVSQLMIDKLATMPKTKLDRRIGKLSDEDMVRLNRAILVFLGLAG